MEVLTNVTAPFKFRRAIWINDMVFRSILVVVSLYLLIALLYHQLKFERPRTTERFFQLSVRRRYERLSRYVCNLIAFASFCRPATGIVSGILETNQQILSDESIELFCNIIRPLANIAVTAGMGFIYLFLWLRQTVFYVDSSMRVINNKCLQIFSFCIIIIWVLFWISLYFVYFIKISYRYDDAGICQYVLDSGIDWDYALAIIIPWTVMSILIQLCLLGLFTYPLLKPTIWLRNQNQTAHSDFFIKKVKKAVVLAMICFATDILSCLVLIAFFEENANNPTFPYSTNLVITHLATIFWFGDWKEMLRPWSSRNRTLPSRDSPHTITDAGCHTSIRQPRSTA